MESFVDRLAERVGIAPSFVDALQQQHETTPATKQTLLKAMGYGAESDAAAERTLQQMERAEAGRALPACVVLYADRDPVVPVRLPEETGTVRWTVGLEGGEERAGSAAIVGADNGQLLRLPERLPWGYHRLRVGDAETSLIVTPGRCWLPGEEDGSGGPQGLKPRSAAVANGTQSTSLRAGSEAVPLQPASKAKEANAGRSMPLQQRSEDESESKAATLPFPIEVEGETASPEELAKVAAAEATVGPAQRFWGVAVQMYLLRSERNWGIGDFSDLRRFVEIVREQGGQAVGVNPLHEMFLEAPEQCSPYSPLSRYMLNVLNLDVEAVPGYAGSAVVQGMVSAPAFQETLARCRAADRVAYADVASLKLPVLRALFLEFEQSGTAAQRASFQAFHDGCDELLRISCVYEAIRQYMVEQNQEFRDCGRWPEGFKHAASEGVAEFTKTHAALVAYHVWLQWVCDEQLKAVKQACKGMTVGLYRDLAVGANPSGAEIWSNPEVMVSTAEVGAPPDILNTAGQNWVLPPFHPQRMKEDGYRSFIALLRSNMRHAGGMRIDHAMALERLYWIPRGGTPRDGGYVHYPIEDMIGVIALESYRNQCLVVGEDLGTVPHGFRERMAEGRILSYKVLLLEEEEKGGGYVKGGSYQKLALSTASSHDLPTLRGWWEGVDLALRERLGITPADKAGEDRAKREQNRASLVAMCRDEGLLKGDAEPSASEFIDAAHRFLLRTQAVLMMAQLEDVVEQAEQVNLPASMPDQYPSWSQRVGVTLEQLGGDPRLHRLAAMAREERGAEARRS